MEERVGITTTLPVEVILAAGLVPIDLNNLFISHARRAELLKHAELDGFVNRTCAWIRGIYSAVLEEKIKTVVPVYRGDCSNTEALAEVLSLEKIRIVPFAYPIEPKEKNVAIEIKKIARLFKTTVLEAEKKRKDLLSVRKLLSDIDNLNAMGKLPASAAFRWLVSSSDFEGDPKNFENKLGEFLSAQKLLVSWESRPRLGFIGVPPIIDDLLDTFENLGAHIAYLEVPRQFAMLNSSKNLAQQYARYTYPYGMVYRLNDILREIKSRSIVGLVHYVQSFCHRQIEDIVLRRSVDVPVLTIEADEPANVSENLRVRIEAFLEMLEP